MRKNSDDRVASWAATLPGLRHRDWMADCTLGAPRQVALCSVVFNRHPASPSGGRDVSIDLMGSTGIETMARTAAWLAAWDSHGIHRTATEGDEAGARWLADEISRAGFEVFSETFQLDRLSPVACHLELDGERIAGVPMFDAPATPAGGVLGRLSREGGDDAILIAELAPSAVYTGELERLRRDTAHRALVIICAGAFPGLGLLNAEHFRNPYGAPAIHVSSEAKAQLFAGMERRAAACVIAENRYARATARNVLTMIPGRSPSIPPIVVMTPRSSWWQSTSERGGGLVCWLKALRALATAPPGCDTVFSANSGHELGHLGLDEFMARRPGWERPCRAGGATWVHFGANIGAAGGTLAVQSANDDLRELARARLVELGQAPDLMPPKSLVPSGETRDIHRAGGRYVTLVGSNPLFHLPQDRWPGAVDLGIVDRVASAAARLVLDLTR